MKTLKIVLISVLGIILALIIGLVIFLKTVDVNHFLPPITAQAAKATGRDVRIGKAGLQLSFLKGVILELRDVSMSDDAKFSDKPFVTLDRVALGVDLGMILRGQIAVSDVTVESPRIVVVRNKDGQINASTIGAATQAPPSPAAQSQSVAQPKPGAAPVLPAFLVKSIHVTNGAVSFVDQSFSPSLTVELDKIDILVKDLSLASPFDVAVKASVFSTQEDIALNGQVTLDLASSGARIKGLKTELDMGKVALDKLIASLPMLKPAGLKEMKGALVLDIKDADLGASGLKSLNAALTLSNGHALLETFPVPFENIALNVDLDEKEAKVSDLSCTLSTGTIHVQGAIKDYMASPVMNFKGTAQAIEAKGISDAYKLPVKANGKVNADFEASFSGKAPDEIMNSLDAQFKADMKEGSLEGINLLKTGLANIPMLPGLLASVQSGLPAETQADLEKDVTVVNLCEVVAKAKGNLVTIEKAQIVTRDVTVSATGTVKLMDTVDMKADLYIEKALAQALIAKVKDLSALRTDDGRVYILLFVNGPLMKPLVQPDMKYLTQKLLVNRGQEQLQKVFQKNPQLQGVLNSIFGGSSQDQPAATQNGETQGQPAQEGQSTQKEAPAGQAVNDLLNSIFKKK